MDRHVTHNGIKSVSRREHAQTHVMLSWVTLYLLSQPWFSPSPLRKLAVNTCPTFMCICQILFCLKQISLSTEAFLVSSNRSICHLLQRVHGTLFALKMPILPFIGTSIIRKQELTLLGNILLARLRINAIKWISLNKPHIYILWGR